MSGICARRELTKKNRKFKLSRHEKQKVQTTKLNGLEKNEYKIKKYYFKPILKSACYFAITDKMLQFLNSTVKN